MDVAGDNLQTGGAQLASAAHVPALPDHLQQPVATTLDQTTSSDGDATNNQVADKRSGQRFTLMLRFAKLKSAEGEFLCVLRNVSANGASAKLFHPLIITGPVEIEMPNGDCIAADMVWQRGDKAGFHFHQEMDLARLIEGPSSYPKRGARLALTVPVELCFGGQVIAATIQNLSQQGAFITCDEHLPLMQHLMVRNKLMPEIRAKVRWRTEGGCGLVFDDTFQYADLARLVDILQRHYAPHTDEFANEAAP